MTQTPASTLVPPPPVAAGAPSLRLFAEPVAIRKGRFLALFLLVNWAVMGAYVLSQGIRSLVGGLAFGLGLFALVGGLTYLRATRVAPTLPLIEIDGDTLRYRRYSAIEPSTLELTSVAEVVSTERPALRVHTTDGEVVEIPWTALSAEDRDRVAARVAQHAAAGVPISAAGES